MLIGIIPIGIILNRIQITMVLLHCCFVYEIIIYWSNEDNAFIAEVPELPGCMAHGNSTVKIK
jgi:hypothetical protein